MSEKLLHRGSVKDIYQLSAEELLFRFSNRYSIFDWGEMPDAIPGKGEALAKLGRKLLIALGDAGFKTHFLRVGPHPEDLIVRTVAVPRDGITIYQKRPTNILIPLEVIYRFGAPKGSSLLKRLKTESDWKHAGFDRKYQEGEHFSEVKIDFTTKLEKLDRALTEIEAKSLSGMNDEEWASLLWFTKAIAQKVKSIFAEVEMELWDGKFEFALDEDRNIMLVDSIGLDEIRLTYQGHPLSKEILRQFYNGSAWLTALNEAKLTDPKGFKEYCVQKLKQAPEPLKAEKLKLVAEMYRLVSELVLNENKDQQREMHKSLSDVMKRLAGAP